MHFTESLCMMFLSIETRDQTEYATLFFQHSLDTILNALSHIYMLHICVLLLLPTCRQVDFDS